MEVISKQAKLEYDTSAIASFKDIYLSLKERHPLTEDYKFSYAMNSREGDISIDVDSIKEELKKKKRKSSIKSTLKSFFKEYQVVLMEVFVLIGIYTSYECGYWLAGKTGSREIALENAHRLVTFEQYAGLYIERPLQQQFLSVASVPVIKAVNSFYMFAHVPCSVIFFLWAFKFHRNRYYEIRNGFFIAHLLTVAVEVLYPCAPPRMLPDLGFVDTIHVYSKTHLIDLEQATGINPYAAMPSMHFSYAAAVGFWGHTLVGHSTLKTLFLCYTTAVFVTIVITANHFVMDCVVAGLLLLIGYLVVWYFPSNVLPSAKTSRTWWSVLYILLAIGAIMRLVVIKRI
mmetsp:Transcript_16752/g.23297  ORF Transcript_16752/g.23297 Transcript_16752/m.23297 type:complete len:344 (-) Transcript_16752:21-1052(-)